jgi:Icc-related predicted phosphoesterase
VRIHAVSDVHGAWDSLPAAAVGADVFICLGDLLLYLDYVDPEQGIYGELFGARNSARYIALRTARRFDEAHEFSGRLWAGLEVDRSEAIAQIVDAQYVRMFAAMPEPALLTYGNVDLPHLWARHLRPGHRVLDGEVIEVDGVRFGFVGGGLFSPYRTPNEISPEVYAAKVAALGSVDVLCAHLPPDLPQLRYDVKARRFERGSAALVDAIRDTQPAVMLFGHVHQPLAARARIGRTECINVGHFRGARVPFVMDL